MAKMAFSSNYSATQFIEGISLFCFWNNFYDWSQMTPFSGALPRYEV